MTRREMFATLSGIIGGLILTPAVLGDEEDELVEIEIIPVDDDPS